MRISDWSSGVCSSDLHRRENGIAAFGAYVGSPVDRKCRCNQFRHLARSPHKALACGQGLPCDFGGEGGRGAAEFGPVAVADAEIGSNQRLETAAGGSLFVDVAQTRRRAAKSVIDGRTDANAAPRKIARKRIVEGRSV